jgi:hypothetical protein
MTHQTFVALAYGSTFAILLFFGILTLKAWIQNHDDT